MINKYPADLVSCILKDLFAIVSDKAVYSHLILSCIKILMTSSPLTRNRTK